MMPLTIALDADPEWDSSIDWADLAQAAADAAIAESAFPGLAGAERRVELSVRLADDEEVRELNAQWRGKDRPTNVLSFPMAEADDLAMTSSVSSELMLGDIILAHGVCAREADERHLALPDHARHLLVHGTLHLLGYDHADDAAADDMEQREVRALARLGLGDPYGAA